jgi:tetratricopeptide (TPR) repeat protein/transglutaminase-like putative cysteine protease
LHRASRLGVNRFLLMLFTACLSLASTSHSYGQERKPNDYSKESLVVERAAVKVVFENDGKYVQEAAVRVHIQSQAGIHQYGMLNIPYPSANATMEVGYVRVIKANGSTVQTPPENSLDMPADVTRQAPYYSDLKVEQVAVKGLEIGDTVEYQYRMQVKTPIDPGQFWFFYDFITDQIALEEILQISVPRDRYVKVQSPKFSPVTTEEDTYRINTWKTANLERKLAKLGPRPREPEEPEPPSVQLTTFHSWDELGQWLHGLFSPRAAVTPEIQSKADELTRGAKSDAEKIQAIYNFVSTKFRYIGISPGIGRFQPHAAADVLTNDYGDCKDKHTLFAALLAAEKIKAYPALIRSSGKIDPDVPSPAQFDHIISALPQGKKFEFVDTTSEVAPLGLLLQPLRDKQSLVMPDDASAQLVQTPSDPPFKSFFTFQADGTLDDSGTLVSKMQMTFRGDAEVIYRTAIRKVAQPQWNEFIQRVSTNLGYGGTVSDVAASAPDATDTPFHIEYNYTKKEYSDWENKRISPPFLPIFLPEAPDETEKEPKPIKLGSPGEELAQATIKLPANAKPEPPAPLDLTEHFAEYHSSYSFYKGVMHVERHIIVKEHEVAPAEFEAYRKFEKAIKNNVSAMIPLFGSSSDSEATEGRPEARALYDQGRQAWMQHNLLAASEAFQKAVEKDPQYALAWLNLGRAHYYLGDLDQSVIELKKAIALDPAQDTAYKTMAAEITAAKHNEQALDLWRELRKTSPQDTDASRNVAIILARQEHYPEAIAELDAALKVKPGDSSLLLQLGRICFKAGDKEKGAVNVLQAAQSDSRPFVQNDAAYYLADNNVRLEDALVLAEKAVRSAEQATTEISLDRDLTVEDIRTVQPLAAFWDTLGWVHFRLKHYELAEKYLLAAWSLTQNPVGADHLGQAYEKESKIHEAAVAYARALSMTGNPPEETRARWNAVRPGGKHQAGEDPNPGSLQDLRTIKVGRLAKKHVTAEFFLLFASGSKPVGVKFINGSEELRDSGKTLAAAKFDVPFPDPGPVQILRRGILDCEPELPNCLFVLIPPDSVQSAN